MLPKEKLERQVIDNLKSKVLTDENIEELIRIVKRRPAKLAAIDAELG